MRIALAFLLLTAAACATTTKIVSEPSGAAVIDDTTKKEIGKTPLTYESKMWIWDSQKVTLKAPGKKPKTVELKRSEVNMVPMVGGIALTVCTGVGCCAGLPWIAADGLKFPEVTKVKLDNAGEAPPTGMVEAKKADRVCMKY